MRRAELEAFLAAGLSLEAIGRRVSRHLSTVAYWLRKHGLAAVHAERHSPKGGISRERLEALVDEDLSLRAMAHRLGLGMTTVRYWLRRHELETVAMKLRRLPPDQRPKSVIRRCGRHGRTRFVGSADGRHYRWARCRAERVARQRRRNKLLLVAEAGGACRLCGYDRNPAALHFHHLDPAAKAFALSRDGAYVALDRARVEARKCALLCANCHAEVETGAAEVPAAPLDSPA
jgi:transposase